MGRQWNQIIESLGPLSGGTMSINANLTEIEALLTTLQADVADGITVSSGTVTANGGDFTGVQAQAQPPERAIQLGYYDSANGEFLVVNEAGIPIQTINPLTIQGSDDGKVPISGTVTVGTLTNGTVNATPTRGTTTTGTLTAGTTNGTLFASNASRNYLLVQCTSGTAFIDTNGTASTANGIQLTSGQGITFEGSFIPTGAIAAITSTGTAQLIGRQG